MLHKLFLDSHSSLLLANEREAGYNSLSSCDLQPKKSNANIGKVVRSSENTYNSIFLSFRNFIFLLYWWLFFFVFLLNVSFSSLTLVKMVTDRQQNQQSYPGHWALDTWTVDSGWWTAIKTSLSMFFQQVEKHLLCDLRSGHSANLTAFCCSR